MCDDCKCDITTAEETTKSQESKLSVPTYRAQPISVIVNGVEEEQKLTSIDITYVLPGLDEDDIDISIGGEELKVTIKAGNRLEQIGTEGEDVKPLCVLLDSSLSYSKTIAHNISGTYNVRKLIERVSRKSHMIIVNEDEVTYNVRQGLVTINVPLSMKSATKVQRTVKRI